MSKNTSGQIGRVHLTAGNTVTADDGTEGRIVGIARSPQPGKTEVCVEDANGRRTDHESRNLRDRD